MGAADVRMRIERLSALHDVNSFACGQIELDEYLRRYALINQRRHLSTTYVALDGQIVTGFVTIAPSQISCSELSPGARRGLPRYPLPTMTLARLAAHEDRRGAGVGRQLLRRVLLESMRMAGEFGCIGVRVFAKPSARGFYERFGFVEMEPAVGAPVDASVRGVHLFLPLNRIEDALRPNQ